MNTVVLAVLSPRVCSSSWLVHFCEKRVAAAAPQIDATQPVGAYALPAPVFYVWYVWATVTGQLIRK